MKNCELFKTEEELWKAWEKRKEILHIEDDSDFTKWACFDDPDYALLPEYAAGKVFIYHGRYVISKGPSSRGRRLTYMLFVDNTGTYYDEVGGDNFKPVPIPSEILEIARAQVLEEMKGECPILNCKKQVQNN